MCSTRGIEASSGLNGFASQPRKPHTTVVCSNPPPSRRAVVWLGMAAVRLATVFATSSV